MKESKTVHLELLLFQALLWMDESLQATLAARGLPVIGRSQSMILLAIESGVKRPVRLARLMGVSRQAIRNQLQELTDLGVLELVEDPTDGRAKVIRIQDGARALVDAAREALWEAEHTLEGRIGKAHVARLRDALREDWGPPVGDEPAQ